MKVLRPYRVSLLILLAGLLVRITGGIMKILHWPGADYFWLGGAILMIAGIGVFIFQFFFRKD